MAQIATTERVSLEEHAQIVLHWIRNDQAEDNLKHAYWVADRLTNRLREAARDQLAPHLDATGPVIHKIELCKAVNRLYGTGLEVALTMVNAAMEQPIELTNDPGDPTFEDIEEAIKDTGAKVFLK